MTRYSLLFLGVVLLSAPAAAQTNRAKNAGPARRSKTIAIDAEAQRVMKDRRTQAESMLISLAADAATYNDLTLRARTLSRIADVLWGADAERARTLFRKAWDAAEVVDREELRRLEIDIRQNQAKGENAAVAGPSNIVGELLRIAARHDRALAEEFLAKITVDKEHESTEANDRNHAVFEVVNQRLAVAQQLLDVDVARAVQFADPALASVTTQGVDFLSYLRKKDLAAADRRYAAMLSIAAADPRSDANTVSTLSSYLFTPHIFVSFQNTGVPIVRTSADAMAPELGKVPVELRAVFFRVARDILMRPLSSAGQDQTSAGVQGKYLVMKRLLPLFDEFAPKELADGIRAQIEALTNAVPESARELDDDSMRQGIRPAQSEEDREKLLLDAVNDARTADERDGLYLTLARLYEEKDDLRGRDFVDKIENTDLREAARLYFDGALLMRAVDEKNTDRVLQLVRTGDLSHLQKAWGLAEATRALVRTDRDRSTALLDEATMEARRIEASDSDRPRALLAVANAWLMLDREKGWDAAYDAVRAANSAEGFTGEDGAITIRLQAKSIASIRSSAAADFDVAGLFSKLAVADFNRSIELARGFTREAPRAGATIAIAKTVLDAVQN